MEIVTKDGNLNEFLSEEKLYAFEPNFKGANSWRRLEDIPDKKKATPFFFETSAKKEQYMTPVRKNGRDYAKIYIVGHNENVGILYVERAAVCQGERYHRNRQGN